MKLEAISRTPEQVIRRLTLAPGEATHWHSDPCRRFTVVVQGSRLRIEYREAEPLTVDVPTGTADWDDPDPRVHRARNVGSRTYEEVVTFYLPAHPGSPDRDPQPEAVP